MSPSLENTTKYDHSLCTASGGCKFKQQQQQATVTTKEMSNNLDTQTSRVKHLINDDHMKLSDEQTTAFQTMINQLELAFSKHTKSVDVDELWRILEEYKSTPSEWSKYAYYDMQRYKRNLVAEFEKFNVMILCWGPKTRSCIHDHSGSHCFMKVIDGELVESRFAWPSSGSSSGDNDENNDTPHHQEMSRLSEKRMNLNDVLYINDKVGLHLVENPNHNKTAASLHVYIPPYRKCKAFDQRTGQARDCKMNFYSKCGRIIQEDDERV